MFASAGSGLELRRTDKGPSEVSSEGWFFVELPGETEHLRTAGLSHKIYKPERSQPDALPKVMSERVKMI